MTPKKKITKNHPSYYIPLPYAMAVRRTLNDEALLAHLFEGMVLQLKNEGVINVRIAVVATVAEQEITLGYVPKGMVSRVEGLLEHEQNVCISLERLFCDRLKHSFWVCFDELPSLGDLGI